MSEIAGMLTQWLNRSKDSSAYERVYGLQMALRGLEPLLREHPANADNSPGALLRSAINEQLDAYTFKPSVSFTDTHSAGIHWFPTSTDKNKADTAEHMMVRLVCDLYNEGTLSHLRECLCGKWFMARSGNQECCSTTCRQKKWGQTDKGKEASKLASRAFYDREQRQPKLKAIKAAAKEWSTLSVRFRHQHDEKEWIAKRASVKKAFVSRALGKGEVVTRA